MFSGDGGREAGGQVPASVIEYLEGKGYPYRIERGTEIVTIVIRRVPSGKVRGTANRIYDRLEAANAPANIQTVFLDVV